MKIGVISDTHVRELNELPRKLVEALTSVDIIVHAGDYTHKRLLDELKTLGAFKGVYGNTDPKNIRVEMPAITLFLKVRLRLIARMTQSRYGQMLRTGSCA